MKKRISLKQSLISVMACMLMLVAGIVSMPTANAESIGMVQAMAASSSTGLAKPSKVTFIPNVEGLVSLPVSEVTGDTFTYNVPDVSGYKITDIKVNGVSVFESAEALSNGYQLTIVRDALSYEVRVDYVAQTYAISYVYNPACTIKVENSQVGHGGAASYAITMKNGNDIVKAEIDGVDVTEKLVKVGVGYILTIKNVMKDCLLTITAAKENYSITIQNAEGGTLSASKSNVNAFGSTVITAELSDGYALAYYLVNGVKTASKDGVLTIENIAEDITVSAVYISVAQQENAPQGNDSSSDDAGCSGSIGAYASIAMVAMGVGLFMRKKARV